jgi:serine palmitoyltransferase
LNLSSYNYLGFAEASGPCADAAVEAIKMYGCAMCSPVQELGELSVNITPFLLINYALIFSMHLTHNC